jgi:hypothetical protein
VIIFEAPSLNRTKGDLTWRRDPQIGGQGLDKTQTLPVIPKPKDMKTRTILMLALALAVLAVTGGCDRALVLKTKLGDDEQIATKAPVLVDGVEVGYVKELMVEAGKRIAVLAVTDKRIAQERIKVGVVRVTDDGGRIVLRTDTIKSDATVLHAGAYIPTKSKAQYQVEKLTSRRTLAVVTIVVVVVVLIVICLKSAVNAVAVLLALALAGVSA